MYMTIDYASKLYRAMSGDSVPQETITLGEVVNLHYAERFDEFLAINGIQVYEEVIR